MSHAIFIIFVFAFGACVGSFLNVVVWRMPRGESIVTPPSRCPKCGTRLAWYDNIPVLGWIALAGRCRYCRQPISIRYPIFEALAGGLFVLVYAAMFIWQMGPCTYRPMTIQQDWPMYLLYVITLAGLLAASLIDAEYFIIPIEIPWLIAALALVAHAIFSRPMMPGALNATPQVGAMAAGATLGVIASIVLMWRGVLPRSFAEGAPLLEFERAALPQEAPPPVEFTSAQIRREMQKEMLFLMPPLVLGGVWLLLSWKVPAIADRWNAAMQWGWLSALLGSLWGGLIGAFIVWFTRIAGSLAFGREAMGLGDVHLMFGIGAVIGAAGAGVVFFVAPFIGLLLALYKLIFRRGRELPYGPFLSIATLVVLLFYCPIIEYLSPSMQGLMQAMQQFSGGE